MTRLRGRYPRGKRLVAKVPHGHWKMTTFVAGLRQDGMTAPFVVDAPMNGEIFLTYLAQCLVPTLSPGEIVTMDNLPAHKVAACARQTRQPAQSYGCCHLIPLISIQSSSPSQNSKPICERPVSVQFLPSGIESALFFNPTPQRSAATTSGTQDTDQSERILL